MRLGRDVNSKVQRLGGVLMAVVLLSVMAGCRPELPTVKVGVLATLSGPANYVQTSGEATVDGIKLAVAAWEARGGTTVGGRAVELEVVIKDNGDTPEMAIAAAKELIHQDNVTAIIGPQLSSQAIPVAEIAEEAGIPMISPMSTHPETTANKDYVFRVGFTDAFQGQVSARFAANNLGAAQVAVLYNEANADSQGLADIFKSSFESGGGEVVAFEAYTSDQPQWEGPLQNIKDCGASALFLPNYEEHLYPQAKAARAMGLATTFLGPDTWNAFDFEAIPALEGSFYITHWHPNTYAPTSQTFVAAYEAAHPYKPIYVTSALTYDAFGLLINAIEEEQAVTSEAIREGLVNTRNYNGVSGMISYENSGDPEKNAIIMQVTGGESRFYKLVTP